MKQYSKKIRRQLRQLADVAYQRELDKELAVLEQKFQDWKDKKINGFELSEFIHKFHNDISRELWKIYAGSYGDADMAVSSAVVRGILAVEEIPQEVLGQISRQIEFFRNREKENDLDENTS